MLPRITLCTHHQAQVWRVCWPRLRHESTTQKLPTGRPVVWSQRSEPKPLGVQVGCMWRLAFCVCVSPESYRLLSGDGSSCGWERLELREDSSGRGPACGKISMILNFRCSGRVHFKIDLLRVICAILLRRRDQCWPRTLHTLSYMYVYLYLHNRFIQIRLIYLYYTYIQYIHICISIYIFVYTYVYT